MGGARQNWYCENGAVPGRDVKVEIEELGHLLGPEESVVDIRHIVMRARGKKRRMLVQIFSGRQSEFFVVRAARWERNVKSCTAYSGRERRVYGDAGKTAGRMPRAPQGFQKNYVRQNDYIHEEKIRIIFIP